jgi:hypothetical protein
MWQRPVGPTLWHRGTALASPGLIVTRRRADFPSVAANNPLSEIWPNF